MFAAMLPPMSYQYLPLIKKDCNISCKLNSEFKQATDFWRQVKRLTLTPRDRRSTGLILWFTIDNMNDHNIHACLCDFVNLK